MRRLLLMAVSITITAAAREWRSADGAKSIEAEFGGVKDERVLLKLPDGKSSVLALSALSQADRDFVKLAQVALVGAQTLGAQTFEIQTPVDGGYIARMGTQITGPKGPWTFSGETFFLPKGTLTLERGDKLESRLLYYAGNRTYQPIEADASVIRAFDLTLDDAVNAELRIHMIAGADPLKLAPLVAEPLIDLVSTRGIALPIGKGYFITETDLLENAKTLVLHEDGKDIPAKVIKTEPKLGLAIISCEYEVEPARLLPRQPAQIGQSIFALSIPLTSTRKNLAPPTLTRGIISKAGSGSTFEHDASIDDDAIGGFVLSDKWEPLGVFFRSASRVEGQRTSRSTVHAHRARASPARLPPHAGLLGEALHRRRERQSQAHVRHPQPALRQPRQRSQGSHRPPPQKHRPRRHHARSEARCPRAENRPHRYRHTAARRRSRTVQPQRLRPPPQQSLPLLQRRQSLPRHRWQALQNLRRLTGARAFQPAAATSTPHAADHSPLARQSRKHTLPV
jgi:hypothetical protein